MTAPPILAAIHVHYDTPDGGCAYIDVPLGQLTCGAVAQARAVGSNVRIYALAADGKTLDRVVVR